MSGKCHPAQINYCTLLTKVAHKYFLHFQKKKHLKAVIKCFEYFV